MWFLWNRDYVGKSNENNELLLSNLNCKIKECLLTNEIVLLTLKF